MTRTQAIEAAHVALREAWTRPDRSSQEPTKRASAERSAEWAVSNLLDALDLPADAVPSADERERALVRAGVDGGCEGDDDHAIDSIIAEVDATHPRQSATGESVREWAREIAKNADACHGVRDRLWRTGKVPDEALDAILSRVGPPPTAALAAESGSLQDQLDGIKTALCGGRFQEARTTSTSAAISMVHNLQGYVECSEADLAAARAEERERCAEQVRDVIAAHAHHAETRLLVEAMHRIRALTPPDTVPDDLSMRVAEAVLDTCAREAGPGSDLGRVDLAAIIQRCREAR